MRRPRRQVENRLQVLQWIVQRSALEDRLGDVGARSAEEDGVAVRRARATVVAPSELPPPPWFSTTIVPRSGLIFSAHGRAIASYPPPGGKGTTSRIGRVG